MAASDPLMASVDLWPLDWAPRGWIICSGQMLSPSQYSALYSLLGVRYGGNGQTTFGVPDMRGRVPVGAGQGPGLPNIILGEIDGTPTNTLTINNLPPHIHPAQATVTPGASTGGRGVTPSNVPTANFPLQTADGTSTFATTSNTQMGQSSVNVTIGVTGSGVPINNMQPYLGMNYILCVEGIYPSRD